MLTDLFLNSCFSVVLNKTTKIKKNKANCLLENLNDLKKELLNKLNNRKSNDVINTQWLKDIINPPLQQKNLNSELPDGLINYFEKYIEFKKSENSVTPTTIKKINVFKKMVVRYEKYLKEKKNSNNEIKIFEVDKNFQLNFDKYRRQFLNKMELIRRLNIHIGKYFLLEV